MKLKMANTIQALAYDMERTSEGCEKFSSFLGKAAKCVSRNEVTY